CSALPIASSDPPASVDTAQPPPMIAATRPNESSARPCDDRLRMDITFLLAIGERSADPGDRAREGTSPRSLPRASAPALAMHMPLACAGGCRQERALHADVFGGRW